ncbi:MAG: glycosyltransferase family 4 protein, partial [Gemmataceae bacterium]
GSTGSVPIEFAGWLPAFRTFGNCGQHPQFRHINYPLEGYHFTYSQPPALDEMDSSAVSQSTKLKEADLIGLEKVLRAVLIPWRSLVALATVAPGVGWVDRCRTLWAAARLYSRFRAAGCSRLAALQFLYTRHLTSQYWLTSQVKNPAFFTSIPYTFNQLPWFIEIEDVTTLFFPFVHNGQTCQLNFRELPVYPAVKALLESDECRGILTHIRSTAEMLPRLFQSEQIARKVFYAPLGVELLPAVQRPLRGRDEPIELLFTNSWSQGAINFKLRGGLDVLEAFRLLKLRYPRLRLTLRSTLPELHRHYQRIVASDDVQLIDRKVSNQEMQELHQRADIYLLPAARIHIVSLLGAMAHGLPVVVSDGWGFEEYVDDGRNGLVVRGRYGVSSWADQEAGVLREDYHTLHSPEPPIVAGLVEAVSRLIEDPGYRVRLGQNARQDVEQYYNLDRWNAALKEAFDRGLGKMVQSEQEPLPASGVPELATSNV